MKIKAAFLMFALGVFPVTCLAQTAGDSSSAGTTKEQLTGPDTKNAPNNASTSNNTTTLESTRDRSKRGTR